MNKISRYQSEWLIVLGAEELSHADVSDRPIRDVEVSWIWPQSQRVAMVLLFKATSGACFDVNCCFLIQGLEQIYFVLTLETALHEYPPIKLMRGICLTIALRRSQT